MRLQSTRKQTENLRSIPSFLRSNAHHNPKKAFTPMRASGILFAGIAATAGVSSLAFALQHSSKPTDLPAPIVHTATAAPYSSDAKNDTSVIVENSAQIAPAKHESLSQSSTISGQATINNEAIPLTEGTIERHFTDSNGAEHTVTISINDGSASVQPDSSTTNIHVYSSSLSNGTNTTRGSPAP